MIDLDLVLTVDGVEELLEDLGDEELLRVGQAEASLRALFGENTDGTTTLGALLEILLNQGGINLLALDGEGGDMDVETFDDIDIDDATQNQTNTSNNTVIQDRIIDQVNYAKLACSQAIEQKKEVVVGRRLKADGGL